MTCCFEDLFDALVVYVCEVALDASRCYLARVVDADCRELDLLLSADFSPAERKARCAAARASQEAEYAALLAPVDLRLQQGVCSGRWRQPMPTQLREAGLRFTDVH